MIWIQTWVTLVAMFLAYLYGHGRGYDKGFRDRVDFERWYLKTKTEGQNMEVVNGGRAVNVQGRSDGQVD